MSKKLVISALITVGLAAAGVAQADAATTGDAKTGVSFVSGCSAGDVCNWSELGLVGQGESGVPATEYCWKFMVGTVRSAENASRVNQRYFENDNCTGRSVDVPGISSANFADFPMRSHIGY
ncbi:peptidase inhibitor family I36 protein [Nocardia sp. NPDC052254]|uniref:peptidase inhibitor family I36 protein n=1 Tax=Nocardia sp. NPDC052254 TaxID=3155681 RepID=UPI0034498836